MKLGYLRSTIALLAAIAVCATFGFGQPAANPDSPAVLPAAQESIKAVPNEAVREVIEITPEELADYGLADAADDLEREVPCLQTVDGYIAFRTIAKGKWSGMGWCGPEPPDTSPCLSVYPPPPYLCVIPSRPAFESVIRDWCTWEDFWYTHWIHDTHVTPPPAVDFDNYLVIAVVLGERENCGYEVTIRSIQLTECGARVRITECVQMGTEPRTVNPYHFVMVPKSCIPFSRRVCFDHGSILPVEEAVEVLP